MPISSLLSLGKIAIKSRPTPSIPKKQDNEILIIGNGPSAKQFLEDTQTKSIGPAVLCVNKFAFGPYFKTIKPKYYLLLDGDFFHFNDAVFNDPNKHPRVKIKPEFAEWQHQINETWENLFTQNWGMTLFIPMAYKNSFMAKKAREHGIKIATFNYTVIKGMQWFRSLAYQLGLGMPQSQNVINAALFLSIKMQPKKIYVTGIDHDFHKNLVLENNVLFEEVSHFYTDKPFRHPLVHADGSGPVRLRQVFLNLHKVHVGYEELHRYAKENGVEVFNITPGGFVDEFPRTNAEVVFTK
jgi:hypothetical protein